MRAKKRVGAVFSISSAMVKGVIFCIFSRFSVNRFNDKFPNDCHVNVIHFYFGGRGVETQFVKPWVYPV